MCRQETFWVPVGFESIVEEVVQIMVLVTVSFRTHLINVSLMLIKKISCSQKWIKNVILCIKNY